MQNSSYVSALSLALCTALALPVTAARAQVTTNTEILDTITDAKPKQNNTATQNTVKKTTPKHTAEQTSPDTAQTSQTKGNTKSASAPANAPLPDIPQAAPPVPVLAPPPPDVALHPFPIPPQPTVDLKAVGVVTEIKNGIRVTFAPGAATLNPITHQAILTFGQKLAENPYKQALINAYSSGAENDPSLPRRMAFTRGLTARSVLMNAGIPSTRIYLRVIGAAHKTTDPDVAPDDNTAPDSAPASGSAPAPTDYIDITQSGEAPS